MDPFEELDKYGADALRWYMLTNAQPWDNLKFDEAGVDEVRRKFFGTLYNTYSFFALYANVDGFDPKAAKVEYSKRPEIDRWIISLLNTLKKKVVAAYEDYDITTAGRLIQDFVCDDLSNWYVRLNRKRFWGGKMDEDKLAAYQTLYEVLVDVAVLGAPIAPFYMDRLYLDLVPDGSESVHYVNMPGLRRGSHRHRSGGEDESGPEGHIDGARASPQGLHQGPSAAPEAHHPCDLRKGQGAA